MSDVYKYDDQSSYESNYNTWNSIITKERRDNKEKPHAEIIAKRIFSEQYGRKSIKETISGLLKDR